MIFFHANVNNCRHKHERSNAHTINKITDELVIPTELTKCNISSIYKNLVLSFFDKNRGVFSVTNLINILDKLLGKLTGLRF